MNMDVVVTSVSKKPERQFESPAAIYSLSAADIERSGLDAIPELLRRVPGMNVARINGNTWAVSTRGLNGQFAANLLVLMDGRCVYTPSFGGVQWSGVDYLLADIDRIEAIRGPGATLWGANAVNGVVNIISKPADQTQGLLFETRLGTFDSSSAARFGGAAGSDTFYRTYLKYGDTDSSRTNTGDAAHDSWNSLQTGFRVDHHLSAQSSLTVQGDLSRQRMNETYLDLAGGPSTPGDARLEGGNILARWTRTPSTDRQTSVQFFFNRQDWSTQPLGYSETTFDLELQSRFAAGARHDITWGLDARESKEDFAPAAPLEVSDRRQSAYLFSGFAQDQIELVPHRLQWSIGTKLEYHELSGFQYEPGTRLAWTPSQSTTVWAAIARSVRIPSFLERSILSFGPAGVEPERTSPETAMSYELGYRVQPFGNVTLDVAAFHDRHRDFTQVPQADFPILISFANTTSAHTWGAELTLDWQVTSQWRLNGSYSLLQLTAHRQAGISTDTLTDSALRSVENSSPEHQFQIHSELDITPAWQAHASLYYVERLPAIEVPPFPAQEAPAYVRLDLSLTWKLADTVSLMLGAQNLLDRRHVEFGNSYSSIASSEVPRSAFVRVMWHDRPRAQ